MAPSSGLSVKNSGSLFSHVKFEHLVAGMSGGIVSTLALHPLDLIKIRFQVNEGLPATHKLHLDRPQYRGVVDAFLKIGKNQGIKGLYQGVTPNLWGTSASWGLYFLFYNTLKSSSQKKQDVSSLSASEHMLIAAQAGSLTLAITNPIWVAKTRLCLQYEGTPGSVIVASQNRYKGMFDCMTKIYKVEGIKGLYRGFIPGLFGVSHGSLQFMAYEELKKMYNKKRSKAVDAKLNSLEYIGFAALSKIFAASITYPYQVVRSRLQDQHRSYGGVIDVIQQTWRLEGGRGFYKGITPSLIRVVPACCITFVVYEKTSAYLLQK